jgi:hypothetical protein
MFVFSVIPTVKPLFTLDSMLTCNYQLPSSQAEETSAEADVTRERGCSARDGDKAGRTPAKGSSTGSGREDEGR